MSSGLTFKSNYSLRSNDTGSNLSSNNRKHGVKSSDKSTLKYNTNSNSTTPKKSYNLPNHNTTNDKEMVRRRSSFNTPTSPWDRRRSFVSDCIISDDKLKICELKPRRFSSGSSSYTSSSYSYMRRLSNPNSNSNSVSSSSLSFEKSNTKKRIPSFSLSLSESQGFSWNEEIFDSNYRTSYTLTVLNKENGNSNNGNNPNRNDGFYNVIDIIVDEDEDEGDNEMAIDDDADVDGKDEYIFEEF